MDAEAEFQDDEPEDEEIHRVENPSRRAANFIDEDEDFEEAELVDMTKRSKQTNPYMSAAFAQNGKMPPLPPNLQKMKDMFDLLHMQKEMVSL
jgi:hypothetical protein